MSNHPNIPYQGKSINPIDVPTLDAGLSVPEIMIGAVIDFEKAGKRLDMDFSHVQKFTLRSGANHNIDKLKYIKELIKNPGSGGGNSRTKKMRLAIMTPVYIALRLSDKTDWQFMMNYAPFQLPKSGNNGAFYDAEKYKLDATGEPIVVAVESGIRLALMKYYPLVSGNKPYDDRFNINLEFLMNDHGMMDQKIPIIIDPEVGWPVGTKPD